MTKKTMTFNEMLEGVPEAKPTQNQAQFEKRFTEAEAMKESLANVEPGPRIRVGRPRKAEPKVSTVMLSVRIPTTVKTELEAMASTHGWTVAEEARSVFERAASAHRRHQPVMATGGHSKRRAG
jgi:hypothetical protein